jgi:exonuclease SbcD
MKLLHTADWHLGDTFHGYDRTDEHRHFLDWLLQTVCDESPDALLVSGDIFDHANPPATAERLLYDFLTRVTSENTGLRVILTAGNHDSSYRLEAPAALYRRLGIEVRGVVPRTPKDAPDMDSLMIPLREATEEHPAVVVLAVPFLRSEDLVQGVSQGEAMRLFFNELIHAARKRFGPAARLVLQAHFYATGAEVSELEHSERIVVGGQECVNATGLGNGLDYVALGHIHKAQAVAKQPTVRYAGSVLPMSFAEKHYNHGIERVVLADDGTAVIERVTYEPPRRLVSVPENGSGTLEDVLRELTHLPKNHGDGDGNDWPYLEVKVQETTPDPSVAAAIVKTLDGRAVRLCRVLRSRPDGQRAGERAPMATLEDLQKINPVQIARDIYRNRYGEDMPDEVARLFAQAKRSCEEEQQTP